MYMWHDSCMHVPWLIPTCATNWGILDWVWYRLYVHVTWLIHTCAMTHWYVCHELRNLGLSWYRLYIHATRLSHTCETHDSCVNVISIEWQMPLPFNRYHVYTSNWEMYRGCVVICYLLNGKCHELRNVPWLCWTDFRRISVYMWLIHTCAMTHSHDSFVHVTSIEWQTPRTFSIDRRDICWWICSASTHCAMHWSVCHTDTHTHTHTPAQHIAQCDTLTNACWIFVFVQTMILWV